MKRTPIKNKSKQKTSVLKKKLWEVFSKYIRNRDRGICFICGRRCEGSGYHAAHFIPKSVGGLLLYFHEVNVHGCCYHCNINLGGNLYEYGMKLGSEKVKSLYSLKGQISKWTEEDYNVRIQYYKNKISQEEPQTSQKLDTSQETASWTS